jgi:hypothetical protein
MEQRILWRAQKPWSKGYFGGLKNHGAQNLMEDSENMAKESYGGLKTHGAENSLDCSEPLSKEFCGMLTAMEQRIL